jgi:hypothetical protein
MSGSYRAQDPCLIAPYGEQIALSTRSTGESFRHLQWCFFYFPFQALNLSSRRKHRAGRGQVLNIAVSSRHTLNVRCVLSGNRVSSAIGSGISPCSCM